MSTDYEYHAPIVETENAESPPVTAIVKILLTLLIVAVAAVGIYFASETSRYIVVAQSGEDGHVYKLDRRTGMLWLVMPGQAYEMENVPLHQKNQPPEEKAMALAK